MICQAVKNSGGDGVAGHIVRPCHGCRRSDGESVREKPQFPRFTGTQHQSMGPKRDLVAVSVGRGMNDVEAGQNDVPVRFGEDGARLWESAAARCAGADWRGVPLGSQSLAAPANPFSETLAPERVFASKASAFLCYIAQSLRCLDVRQSCFGDCLNRHHVGLSARRVRKGGGESGREGMPSFSAVRIDASSRVRCVVDFDAGIFKLGSGVPFPE